VISAVPSVSVLPIVKVPTASVASIVTLLPEITPRVVSPKLPFKDSSTSPFASIFPIFTVPMASSVLIFTSLPVILYSLPEARLKSPSSCVAST